MTDLPETVCYRCGNRYGARRKRCDCGEPLWFDATVGDYDWPTDGRRQGMWRHDDLLPVDTPVGVGEAAGGTPLFRAERLDEYAGCRVSVKDETENPTGSFKDRGSAVGVAAAAAWDARVGTVSHGNMAMSVAATAAGAGLDSVVLVPDDISRARLAAISQFDPTVVRVAGDYGRLYDETLAIGPGLGIEFVNSDSPLRVAGQKTVALELMEQFGPDPPDAIVLPVSSGGNASGVWKALRELEAAGLVATLPRIYLVQAAACAPIAEAFDRGDETVTPVDGGDTVAYSIANADPPSGTRALAAVRATGGAVVSVDDEQIRDAQSAFARRAGLSVEAASATVLAGLRRLSAGGRVEPDDDVVVVATGTGFRELAADAADVPVVALDDLEAALSTDE